MSDHPDFDEDDLDFDHDLDDEAAPAPAAPGVYIPLLDTMVCGPFGRTRADGLPRLDVFRLVRSVDAANRQTWRPVPAAVVDADVDEFDLVEKLPPGRYRLLVRNAQGQPIAGAVRELDLGPDDDPPPAAPRAIDLHDGPFKRRHEPAPAPPPTPAADALIERLMDEHRKALAGVRADGAAQLDGQARQFEARLAEQGKAAAARIADLEDRLARARADAGEQAGQLGRRVEQADETISRLRDKVANLEREQLKAELRAELGGGGAAPASSLGDLAGELVRRAEELQKVRQVLGGVAEQGGDAEGDEGGRRPGLSEMLEDTFATVDSTVEHLMGYGKLLKLLGGKEKG